MKVDISPVPGAAHMHMEKKCLHKNKHKLYVFISFTKPAYIREQKLQTCKHNRTTTQLNFAAKLLSSTTIYKRTHTPVGMFGVVEVQLLQFRKKMFS